MLNTVGIGERRGLHSLSFHHKSDWTSMHIVVNMLRFVKVSGYRDFEFVGNITMGTPKQQFSVLLDTGSSDFWVPGNHALKKRKFKPKSSSTFVEGNKTWAIKYEEGEANGVLGTDVMQRFRTPLLDPADGILGLAFTALSVCNVVPPLMNAINQNLLDKPLFTVWMQPRRANATTLRGLLTYGAIDTENCGPIMAYELFSSETKYQFKDRNFTHAQVYEAASDTGTSLIGGPKAVIDRIAKVGIYLVECSMTPPSLDITIGKHKYPIYPDNYVVKARMNTCYFAIFYFESGGFGPDWILGTPFVRQYCNIFDIGQSRLGFALFHK
ncbi:unnamed protein product [Angiostrongylus costaricensis]|uniref:Peptidase A1 domain-containing protein n=1 Tax=Angiostrongylus costaricensis TaxID=334426 RepID=A0A0R3PGY3_ANGCS|nr:unnamed protein product [Angiostrongylus costaricensis]